jgi:hypothetical protein
MLIFGTRLRHKKIGEGEFFCPKCQANRLYHHKKAVRYFTLYFLPVIPIQQLGDFIECQTCGVAFEPAVLSLHNRLSGHRPGAPDLARTLNTLKARLEEGYPVEFMVRDLTADNLDLEVARRMVETAIGPGRKTCERCSLTYAESVERCKECGERLGG